MNQTLNKTIIILLIIACLLLVYKSFFFFGKEISAGDAPFYYADANNLTLMPYLWLNSGMGQFSGTLNQNLYLNIPIKLLFFLKVPWIVIERIIIYLPFLLIGFFSALYFIRTLFPDLKYKFLVPFLYLINTYILMIIGGGQMSIALMYALFPLVFSVLIQYLKNYSLFWAIISGLLLALELVYEPRGLYLVFLLTFFYLFFNFGFAWKKSFSLLVPLLIALVLHAFWIYPLLSTYRSGYASGYMSAGWLSFLSTADFPKSLSLLHPNWSENIFGKTYFMKPEFLLLPLLAFCSLYFSLGDKRIKFFILTALGGAFLAKGINPPFEGIYSFLFTHLPGFNLFRDPTKFYLFTSLSYVVLVPYTLEKIGEVIRLKIKNRFLKLYYSETIIILFLIFYGFLLFPAVSGSLNGTLKTRNLPVEYQILKDKIHRDPEFFRTLWVSLTPRFAVQENYHPALSTTDFFGQVSPEKIPGLIKKQKKYIKMSSIKYVIIPDDFEGEIFLTDRKYDQKKRLAIEKELDKITWLKKDKSFKELTVYKIIGYIDLFLIKNGQVKFQMENPTRYLLSIKSDNDNLIIFSQSYDPCWKLTLNSGYQTFSQKTGRINQFSIKKGTYNGIVEFIPQQKVSLGIKISSSFLVVLLLLLIYSIIKKRYNL